jgi:flagellar hook-associated protein 3 FlgL
MFNTVSTATDRFLADLSNIEQRLVTAQRQVSSGLRMQDPSDSPDQVSTLLVLKANISHNDQLKSNLSHVQTEVSAAESAINTATTLMDSARQIAAQGLNGTTTIDTRNQLASQVNDLITEVFGLTNSNVEGRYVFSGNADQGPPYTGVDLTQANGVGTYQGSNSSRVVEHPNGSTFSVSLTASQVFDQGDATTSVLQSLTSLYNNLLTNNISGLTTDATNLATASSYLSGQQALYGGMLNQITDAQTFQQKLDTQYHIQLSNLQDADSVTAIPNLEQASVAQQAALQAHAAMPTKSLFDFLG